MGTLFVQRIMMGVASKASAPKVPLAAGHVTGFWAITSTADVERMAAIANNFI